MMISVCIAAYNGEEYITAQIKSILPQLSSGDEIIISDDCSLDKTIEICLNFNDPRIKIFKNRKNVGYTGNFENALMKAQGDIIFLSDQDDIWADNKVSVSMEYLEQYDMVVSDATIINQDNQIINTSFFEQRKVYKTIIGNIFKFGYLGCCMAFKKSILQKALPFPASRKFCTHDNWLFLIGIIFFKAIIVDDKLVLYRRHDSNCSTGGSKNVTSFWFKIYYRFYLIYQIASRF